MAPLVPPVDLAAARISAMGLAPAGGHAAGPGLGAGAGFGAGFGAGAGAGAGVGLAQAAIRGAAISANANKPINKIFFMDFHYLLS